MGVWVLQFSLISTLGVFGLFFLHLQRPGLFAFPFPFLIALSLGLELGLSRLFRKTPSAMTALMVAATLFLQLASDQLAPYLVALALAFFFRFLPPVGGRQVYHPVNTALLGLFCLAPSSGSLDFLQLSFEKPLAVWVLILVLGGISVIWTQRASSATSFVLFFCLGAWARSMMTGVDFSFYALPLLGGGTLFYLLFIVCDPVTTPVSFKAQFIGAGAIALIDQSLRHGGFYLSLPVSVALVSCLQGLMRASKSSIELKLKARTDT
jgi:hypothetical protein